MNEYNNFIKAINLDPVVQSSQDMIDLLIKSIEISNKQGYTNILSNSKGQDRCLDLQPRLIDNNSDHTMIEKINLN